MRRLAAVIRQWLLVGGLARCRLVSSWRRLLKLDVKLAEDEQRIADTVKELEGVQKTAPHLKFQKHLNDRRALLFRLGILNG